jgi:antitoxin YefM
MEPRIYTAIRNHLAEALDQVNDDRVTILITRQNGRPAVLMSLEEYRSWEETLHLMRSPANARLLNRAIEQLEAGKVRRLPLLRAQSSGRTRRAKTTSGGRTRNRRSSRASAR